MPIDRRVDGGGRTLLPGLIDAHGHVMGLGLRRAPARPRSAPARSPTCSSGCAPMPRPIRTTRWIVGRGWNQELWPDKRFPTAADLDAVVADRPVVLERVDGHAVVANSAALKAAGITAATKDPVGGKIERDASGKPTGLLVDAAMDLVESKVPAATPQQTATQALAKAQEIAARDRRHRRRRHGHVSSTTGRRCSRAGEAGRLNVRIMAYAAASKPLAAIAPNGRRHGCTATGCGMGGVKLYADGALGSRGAWLKQPYADKPDTRGLQLPHRRRAAAKPTDAGGDDGLPGRDPRDRRRRQRAGHRRLRGAVAANTAATAAGGSSISRSPIPPTSRASRRPGSSPRCSRPTRPATG